MLASFWFDFASMLSPFWESIGPFFGDLGPQETPKPTHRPLRLPQGLNFKYFWRPRCLFCMILNLGYFLYHRYVLLRFGRCNLNCRCTFWFYPQFLFQNVSCINYFYSHTNFYNTVMTHTTLCFHCNDTHNTVYELCSQEHSTPRFIFHTNSVAAILARRYY